MKIARVFHPIFCNPLQLCYTPSLRDPLLSTPTLLQEVPELKAEETAGPGKHTHWPLVDGGGQEEWVMYREHTYEKGANEQLYIYISPCSIQLVY